MLATAELLVPFVRFSGSVVSGTLGTAIAGFVINQDTLGGWLASPFRLPLDYDRTREGRVWTWVYNPVPIPVAGGDVLIRTNLTRVLDGGTPTNTQVERVLAVSGTEAFEQTTAYELLDAAGGPFLAAGSLAPLEILGWLIRRNGPSGLDTFTNAYGLVNSSLLRYHRVCGYGDCP